MFRAMVVSLSLVLQNGPPPTTPYLVSSVAASAPNASSLTVGLPATQFDPAKCAYIAIAAWNNTATTSIGSVTAPGWTEIVTASGFPVFPIFPKIVDDGFCLRAFWKPYGDSSVTFASTEPCGKFEVFVGLLTNINPGSFVSVHVADFGFNHTMVGVNAPVDNTMIVAAWMSPDTPTHFESSSVQLEYSGLSSAATGSAGLTVGCQVVPSGPTGAIGAYSMYESEPYTANGLGICFGVRPY